MTIEKSKDGKIHIGLALAGAITAGAFTAGVLDYLFNTLKLWEKEYKKNPVNVPEPNIVIDVITGSSAGSIVAAAALLSLVTNKMNSPLNGGILDDKVNSYDNLLYHIWVNLGLEKGDRIMDKLLSTEDLENGKMKSLLNSKFIEDLVDDVQKIVEENNTKDFKLPSYINPNLEILMTLSNLRGINIDLKIASDIDDVSQTMSYHKAFAHFGINKSNEPQERAKRILPLSIDSQGNFIKQELETFLMCTRASSAFPLALRSVPIILENTDYIRNNLKAIFNYNDKVVIPEYKDGYEFLAVDGGMTNNEPLAETYRILEEKLGKEEARLAKTILIDPFPSIHKDDEFNIEKDDMLSIVMPLYKTLRNQTLFKEKDLLTLLSDDNSKTMIWPTRKSNKTGETTYKNAIASGGLGGFAGFLHRDYRRHDYSLGMKNCQNFLRYIFTQAPEKSGWTGSMVEKFEYTSEDGIKRLPIIPDFRISHKGTVINSKGKEISSFKPRMEDIMDPYPEKDRDQVITKDLEKGIKERLKAIMRVLKKTKFKNEKYKVNKNSELPKGIKGRFIIVKKRIKGLFFKIIGSLLVGANSVAVKSQARQMIIEEIEYSLAKHDLLKDIKIGNDNKPNVNKGNSTNNPPIAHSD